MKNGLIISPMPTGSGAYVLHKMLEAGIQTYRVHAYSPYLAFFPLALHFLYRRDGIPDLIHTTPDYAPFFRRGKSPLIITFHSFVLDKETQAHSTLFQRIHHQTDLRLFTLRALSKATIVTAVSHFIAALVKKELRYHDNVRIIYNGVNTNTFFPKQRKKTRLIKVLFSGNLTRRKGVDLLPLIAEKVNTNIKIIYTSGLRTKKKLPAHQKLKSIGNVPHSHMPKVYQDGNIFLSPTVREGFGLSIAEAMASGLPVVASDCSSIPELIDHGKGGFLCPVGDVDAFAERINILADSPRLRKEMGEYNRVKVEKLFTVERMVREYKELFQEVLDNRKYRCQ